MPISPELQAYLERTAPSPEKEDWFAKLPDLSHVPDEMTVEDVWFETKDNLKRILTESGLTKHQRAAVTAALGAASFVPVGAHGKFYDVTVGEIRAMSDEDLRKLRGWGTAVGSKRARILRKLFGRTQEEK